MEVHMINHRIGDGSGIMNIFKNAGAGKMKEILSTMTIKSSLLMDLGNNAFTDAGLKSIIEGLSEKSTSLSCFTIGLESHVKAGIKNVFTAEGLKKLI